MGDVNDPPVLAAIGNQTINEGATLSFTASASDADLPSQALTYSLDAASLAQGMTIDANTGVFSWTPTEAQGGLAPSVTITVTDNGAGNLTDSETFTITVGEVNDAPVLAAIGNQTVNEGATLSFTASASDADLPSQALTYSLDAASLALGMMIDANTGVFSWTPTEAQGGLTPSVTITVTDNGTGNLTDSETFTITVGEVNVSPSGAPVVSGITTEDQTLTADTSSVVDPDGLGALTYQWQRSADNGATWSDVGADAASYLLDDGDVGTVLRVVITYVDGDGTPEALTSAQTAVIANVNDAPVGVPVIAGTATQGQTLTADTRSIADADGLGSFSHQWQRNGVDIAGATGSSYTLGAADVGADLRVVVTYVDAHGTFESLTSATVGPVIDLNEAPAVTPVDLGRLDEDNSLRISQADLLAGASDPDGDPLNVTNLTLTGGQGTIAVDLAGGWRFTPDADWSGMVTFGFDVSDGALSVAGTATLRVDAVNDAPWLSVPPALVASSGGSVAIDGLALADVDSSHWQVDLSVQHGTLSIDASGGAALLGGGSGGMRMILSGSMLQLQSALATLRYQALPGQTGDDVLTVATIDDDGAGFTVVLGIEVRASDSPAPDLDPSAPPFGASVDAPPASVAAPTVTVDDLPPAEAQAPVALADDQLPPQAAGDGAPRSLSDASLGDAAAGVTRGDGQPAAATQRSSLAAREAAAVPATEEEPLVELFAWDDGADDGDRGLRSSGTLGTRGLGFEVEQVERTETAQAETTLSLGEIDLADAAAVSFTAGFVWWLTRSGGMLTMMLMGIPAWRHVDLLPVLAEDLDDRDEPAPKSDRHETPDTAFQHSAFEGRLDELFDPHEPVEEGVA